MVGKGIVRNPDGTEKEVTLRAEKPITEKEAVKYGYHTEHSGKQRRD